MSYLGNIGYWIKYWAAINKNKELLIFKDKRITYSAMNEKVNRIANALREKLGIRKGDRIVNLLSNRVEFLEILLACSKIGALIVPMNIRLVEREVEYIVGDASPKVIFTEDTLISKLQAVIDNKAVEHVINVDTDIYENLARTSSIKEPENQAVWEDEFGILYTSGTTGLPKGAVLTQENIKASTHNLIASRGYQGKDRLGVVLPLCFTGTIVNIIPLIHVGGTLVLDTGFDPERYLKMIEKEKLTILMGVPTVFKFLYDHPLFDSTDFSSIRDGNVGGAPMPKPLILAYQEKGIALSGCYGLTEGSGINMVLYPEHIDRFAALQPAMWNEIRVVNDQGDDVGPGEVGELIIKGATVFKGYWNNTEATAETIKNGWLYTGDIAEVDEEGFVFIVDRKKDMIVTGGLNVYGSEVENILYAHPSVREGAVIGVPHAVWGEAVVVAVVPKPGHIIDEKEMIKFFRERLADYKCPKAVIGVEKLPLSTSGKVLKKQLREQFQSVFLNQAIK
ncbi:AMP-binding protein [Neobacillus niacini]|uniref:AMP-binding protein n=1 Tax=Neobacillus niacini TaxID=86668 RepID=UPI002FFE37B4